jgi:hypothetical protein
MAATMSNDLLLCALPPNPARVQPNSVLTRPRPPRRSRPRPPAATFAALAGTTINASGPRPLDSLDVWPHLASCGAAPSPRTELLHHYDGPEQGALRSGDLKLVVGGMAPYCWHAPYPAEAGKTCKPGRGDPDPRDWKCTPCDDKAVPRPCQGANGTCLFNITADPTERHDLAPSMPAAVAALRARYDALGADACTPNLDAATGCLDYVGRDDQRAWVAQTLQEMWIGALPGAGAPLAPGPPPTPTPSSPTPSPTLPPPGPPLAPLSALSGSYASHDEHITLSVAADGSLTVVNTNHQQQQQRQQQQQQQQQSGGGCWTSGTGNVSADGRTIFVNASGAACGPVGLRYGTGRVLGELPAVSITWICAKPPAMDYCGWRDWQQQAPRVVAEEEGGAVEPVDSDSSVTVTD